MKTRAWVFEVFGLLSFAVILDSASCQNQDSNDVIIVSAPGENIPPSSEAITDLENVTAGNATSDYCDGFVSSETGENLTWPGAPVGSTVGVTLQDSICDMKVFRDCLEGGDWSDIISKEPRECIADRVLRILILIGFSVSLFACITAFIVFAITRSSLRTLGHYQYHIHWNLITSFILYPVVLLISLNVFPTAFVQRNVWLRNLLSSLLAYFVLANFFWMLVEGLVLFVLVATSFPGPQRGRAFVKWFLIGWGIPAILVTAWIIAIRAITPADSVFVLRVESTDVPNYVCLIGPIFAALLINCFVLVKVMHILWKKLKDDARNTSEHQRERSSWRAAKSTFVILILLGAYYVLPIPILKFNSPFVLQYVVYYTCNLINSLQGLAVCTLYVFCNGEIRRALKNWRRRLKYTGSLTFTSRLSPTPSTSRSATPRHSKSHSSSDTTSSGGKRPSAAGAEDIEMAVAAGDDTPTRRQVCVVMEPLVEELAENGRGEPGAVAQV